MKRPLDSIRIDERHRKDMGDLARSTANDGLLHPVVVTPAGDLALASAACARRTSARTRSR
jgi:hypothetical protein